MVGKTARLQKKIAEAIMLMATQYQASGVLPNSSVHGLRPKHMKVLCPSSPAPHSPTAKSIQTILAKMLLTPQPLPPTIPAPTCFTSHDLPTLTCTNVCQPLPPQPIPSVLPPPPIPICTPSCPRPPSLSAPHLCPIPHHTQALCSSPPTPAPNLSATANNNWTVYLC
ncbi:YTH domain-containing family protein 1 [Platysternon megacephalum]|uniref:YTH domain-containing family protein 1 n=1 Tax=Platysternon megacephalum TaxID=55544 RepID=A0A4D9EIA7_9SAUR|nr:YTH domain-containing family protein 1 [Platysternon megacephalum]